MNLCFPRMLRPLLAACAAASLSGCEAKRVVFVHPTDQALVRLGPDVQGRVYFWNGSSWELSSNTVRLPEGWYAGYVPPEGEDR